MVCRYRKFDNETRLLTIPKEYFRDYIEPHIGKSRTVIVAKNDESIDGGRCLYLSPTLEILKDKLTEFKEIKDSDCYNVPIVPMGRSLRIEIPKELAEYANLSEDVVLITTLPPEESPNIIGIWDKELHEKDMIEAQEIVLEKYKYIIEHPMKNLSS
jgi:DNA-binding transcriptional regulator/RsmH inhibitor MraZ